MFILLTFFAACPPGRTKKSKSRKVGEAQRFCLRQAGGSTNLSAGVFCGYLRKVFFPLIHAEKVRRSLGLIKINQSAGFFCGYLRKVFFPLIHGEKVRRSLGLIKINQSAGFFLRISA
jgi:hypothetical protein